MRVRRGQPYRTYTYSLGGYKSLFKEAGFEPPALYLAIPSYRDPEYIVPAEDNRAITYFVRRRTGQMVNKVKRWLVEAIFDRLPPRMSCGMLRQLFYSYLMVAGSGK